MSNQDPVIDYQSPTRTSVAAIVVFWLAIAAAFGFFFILPSLIVFFACLVVQGRTTSARDQRGYRLATVGGWISAIAAGLGLVTFIMADMNPSRELANRSTCQANLRGITQSMNVYAADGGWYPIIGPTYTSTLASALPGTPAPADTLLSSKPGGLYAPANPPGNVCQNMWLLVLTGQVAPKQFICKSDPCGVVAAPSVVSGTSNYYLNFTSQPPRATVVNTDQTYSYSFAFPWTAAGTIGDWWKDETDASLPLLADIAPANATGTPPANTLDGTNKAANSRTHQGDGQNVGFGDGHAEFFRLANAGQDNDNIYSANGRAGPSPRGTTPSSAADPKIAGGSKGKWDIVLVPAADASTGIRK